MASLGGLSVPVTLKVKGIKELVRTVGALIELTTDLRNEMRTAMTEAVASIRADIANAKEGWDAYVATAEAAQADSVRRFEELQTRLDGVLADQDATVQTAVSEAVAAANTANNDALSGLVSEAKALADAIPDAGAAPAEPSEPTPGDPTPDPTPGEPTPPADPDVPAEPTPDQPAPADPGTPADPGDVPPAPQT